MEQAGITINLQGYTVLLPSEAPRHVEDSHGNDGDGQRPAQPEDYARLIDILNQADTLEPGNTTGRRGEQRLVAWKTINGERLRAVWEVWPGKRNRALALVSLVIKTAPKAGA